MFVINPDSNDDSPGIVQWVMMLYQNKCISLRTVQFATVAVTYTKFGGSVKDAVGDSLTFHTALFGQMHAGWRKRVAEEIQKCDEIAKAIGILAGDLQIAGGGNKKTRASAETLASALWYDGIDEPFRTWLYEIDPEQDDIDAVMRAWQQTAQKLALTCGKDLVEQTGTKALFGKTVELKSGSKTKKWHYSAPEAFSQYQTKINKIYPKEVKA